MAFLYKKIIKGRTYWYIRETHRVDGKVKLKWEKYLGTAETLLAKLEKAEQSGQPLKMQTRSFGALFAAHVLEKELDTIGLVDRIVGRGKRETGPSVGEYFFYAWANRMIDPKSKHALEDWYKNAAVEHIRPVDVKQLTSARYWEKWDRVSEEHLEAIQDAFFRSLWEKRPSPPEAFLFDTTNYYTFMATKTASQLSRRGHSKDGKHHLRQVGLGLLVDRETSLPLYYASYPGNMHDSKLFHEVLEDMACKMTGFATPGKDVTVVFDKGMNAEENLTAIDACPGLHFITTYSPYFMETMAGVPLERFEVLDIPKNQRLMDKGLEKDRLMAYRSGSELWGQARTVVVTFNPVTYRKKIRDLERKLEAIRAELLSWRRKFKDGERRWTSPQSITMRYKKLCDSLHVSSKYYRLDFGDGKMAFRKDQGEINQTIKLMGKTIMVTDNHDWDTEQIALATLDRYKVEHQFRASKSSSHVRVNPIFHWTDSKIRCHLLTCLLALTCLRLLEIKVNGKYSGRTIMEEMQNLNCVITWTKGDKSPKVQIEDPNPIQTEVLKALGYAVKDGWVLQI